MHIYIHIHIVCFSTFSYIKMNGERRPNQGKDMANQHKQGHVLKAPTATLSNK